MDAARTPGSWHGPVLLPAGGMGGWYATCTACPDWQGRAELSIPEARRRHTEHVNGWPIQEPVRATVPPPPRRTVNVDRVMARIVGPLLLAASAAWLLVAGLVSA